MLRKPAPNKTVGCEYCKYRQGDFFKDPEDQEIIRIYCTARHANVNADVMSKFCDFFEIDPNFVPPQKKVTGI